MNDISINESEKSNNLSLSKLEQEKLKFEDERQEKDSEYVGDLDDMPSDSLLSFIMCYGIGLIALTTSEKIPVDVSMSFWALKRKKEFIISIM